MIAVAYAEPARREPRAMRQDSVSRPVFQTVREKHVAATGAAVRAEPVHREQPAIKAVSVRFRVA